MSTRPVPTNLDGWPGVTDLNIAYKHLLHVLWSAPSSLVSVIGVGRPGIIEHLTGAARTDEPVVLDSLREFQRRGLVVLDETTREVAIRRWLKFHKFNGRWAAQAKIAFDHIESATIKSVLVRHEGVNEIFPEKSKTPPPNSNSNSNSNAVAAPRASASGTAGAAAAPATGKTYNRRASGIITWLPADVQAAEAIERQHPQEGIAAAIAALGSKEPVPGRVLHKIEQLQRDRAVAERRTAEDAALSERAQHEIDPAAQAKGEAILAAARKKIHQEGRAWKLS